MKSKNTIAKKTKIKGITVIINDNEIFLTIEDARDLKNSLNELFSKEYSTWPIYPIMPQQPMPLPSSPLLPNTPYEPYNVCNNTTQQNN